MDETGQPGWYVGPDRDPAYYRLDHEVESGAEGTLWRATRVEGGDVWAVKLFVAAGMSPDVKDEKGTTPLVAAMQRQHDDAARALLEKSQNVNLRDLDQRFADGDEVTPATLKARGLATRKGVPVKILGQGEIGKKLTVSAHGFSKAAREKIEAAGGACTVVKD